MGNGLDLIRSAPRPLTAISTLRSCPRSPSDMPQLKRPHPAQTRIHQKALIQSGAAAQYINEKGDAQ